MAPAAWTDGSSSVSRWQQRRFGRTVVFRNVSPVSLVDESCHLWQLGGSSIAAEHHLPVMPATVIIRIHSTGIDALDFLIRNTRQSAANTIEWIGNQQWTEK